MISLDLYCINVGWLSCNLFFRKTFCLSNLNTKDKENLIQLCSYLSPATSGGLSHQSKSYVCLYIHIQVMIIDVTFYELL